MNRKQRRAAASIGRQASVGADAQSAYLVAYDHHSRGDLETAKANYLRALARDPKHPGCLLGLGLIAFKHGLLAEAEDLLRQANEAEPGDANILANLGAVLLDQNKFADCAAICERALAIEPGNRAALINLNLAQGQLAKAAPAMAAAAMAGEAQAAPATEAAAGTADLDQAETLIERGRYRDALDLLAHQDQNQTARYCRLMARTLHATNNLERAVAFARKCCELEPQSGAAHVLLGEILVSLRDYDEALEANTTALALSPDDKKPALDLCQLRQLLCDWDGLVELQRETVDVMLETKAFAGPFHLISMPDPMGSAANQLRCAELYQQELVRAARKASGAIQAPNRPLNDRLKIGYLSSDFCGHATASLIAELIERHDHSRFEIVAYCYSVDDGSPSRQRLQAAFDQFIDINPLSAEAAARRIAEDGIDILVDLKGYTSGSRTNILAYRPAPIQVNYLGYPGTLGADYVDYIIGDEFLTPLDSQPFYTEKIVQLPHCYQPNDTQRRVDQRLMRREDYGLAPDAFVFCSFNNVNKLTREVFRIWMRLLVQVPHSVLWLFATNATAMRNLRREAEACGVNADRLVFAAREDTESHIARMRLADLFLDSFPCSAHTTASETLWAGLPILTCAGETFASRVAGSILTAAGLSELVTQTLETYEAEALRLAQNPDVLMRLRDKVSQAPTTPLFDIATYTRDVERAYLNMASLYSAGQKPAAFAVRDLAGVDDPDIPAAQPLEIYPMQTVLAQPTRSDAALTGEPIDARIAYSFCPLCYQDEMTPVGQSICTKHPLYKAQLPPTINWCLCPNCKHVFADGFFNEEAYGMLYPKTPPAELAGYDVERQRLHTAKIVQRVARLAEAGIWLDVGFGNGSLLFSAEEWGYRGVGLDIRGDNVKAMQELGCEAHELCIEQYDPGEQCSVVSMVNLLQHVPFPGSAIEHAARLLKPKGVLFIVAPNMDSTVWRMLDKQRMNPFWTDLEIYHHFTRKRLYALLMDHGLVPVEYNVSERYRASMEIMAVKPAVTA